MPFEKLKKGRAQGERYPKGFVKRKILLRISSEFPKGVEEPLLRDYLRESWNVREKRGVKKHLDDLKEEGCLSKKTRRGKANIWNLKSDYRGIKSVANRLLKDDVDKLPFVRTDYVQKIVNEKLVDHFAPAWAKKFVSAKADYLEKSGYSENSEVWGIPIRELDDFENKKLRENFYFYLLDLSKEKLAEILRVSPSALRNFLFPERLFKEESYPINHIDAYFLYPLVFDSIIYGIPEGKGIEAKLEVKYGDSASFRERGIDPIFEAKSRHTHISGGECSDENDSSK